MTVEVWGLGTGLVTRIESEKKKMNMYLGQYLNVLLVRVHPVHQDILLSNNTGSIQIKVDITFLILEFLDFKFVFSIICIWRYLCIYSCSEEILYKYHLISWKFAHL